jgi:transcription initiation factor IIF auxiliary subunit
MNLREIGWGYIEIEIEMYLVELHHHRTVPQLTPGFMGLYGLD